VQRQVENKLDLSFEDLGEQEVKNIPNPVRAYRINLESVSKPAAPKRQPTVRYWARAAGVIVLLVGLAVAVAYFAVDKYVLEAEPEQAEVTAEQIPAAESTAQVKSIAVLPFANMSGDPEQEFFSDGISEELLNVLAKVKGLRVTSRTSAFAFKGTNTSIPEIAEKLGVEHVLEGSVRMAGDRVRITTQLIEVETDSHLWSESYDRELSDIFAVQDEIATKVAEALKVALLEAESKPIRPAREIPIEVYTDYLLARQKIAEEYSYVGMGEAERLLKGVIEREPGYAPTYVALASTYRYMAETGMFSQSEASTRMMPLLEHAISLDDRLAEAWVDLAFARRHDGDHEGAREARERALGLDPQNSVVLRDQLLRCIWSREPERALVYADELLRVDPLSMESLFSISMVYLRLGRFADMGMMLEHMRSINPQSIYNVQIADFLASSRGDLVRSPSAGSDSLIGSNLTESSLSDVPEIPLELPISPFARSAVTPFHSSWAR
jgi:TolB-like protein